MGVTVRSFTLATTFQLCVQLCFRLCPDGLRHRGGASLSAGGGASVHLGRVTAWRGSR
ncbi:hypothetical protein GCM10009599_26060 [Luteococcus peritonei]